MRVRILIALATALLLAGSGAAAGLAKRRAVPRRHTTHARRYYHRRSLLGGRRTPPALLTRKGTRKVDLAIRSVVPQGPGAAAGRSFSLLVVARRAGRTPRASLHGVLTGYLSRTAKLAAHRPPSSGHAQVTISRKGTSKPTRLTMVVPIGTKPGAYRAIVCVAVLGKYRDTRASDNCRAASRTVTVITVGGGGSAPAPPAHPAPTPTTTTPPPTTSTTTPPATTSTTTTTTTSTTTTTPPPPPPPPAGGNPPPPNTPVPVNAPAPAPGPADAAAPSAADVAPALTSGEATSFRASIAFLFTGTSPIQQGVSDPSVITDAAAALLHGTVSDTSGHPIGGVRVSVLGNPQYGYTDTASDGTFAMAVDGGAQLALNFARAGYIPVQTNAASVPINQSTAAPAVALTAYQGQADDINLASSAPIQVAEGDVETDASGTRQATLLFSAGTQATMHLPDGSTKSLTDMHVRATEFTVGAYGPAAMPGTLPPTSAYTYADDFTVDEAVDAGATSVTFDKPVIAYVNNFLGFPTGATVPSGSYSDTTDAWNPSPDGVVVKVLSTEGGTAQLSVDSSGNPATAGELSALGITTDELKALATNYAAGDSLWRVPMVHFSSWDFNFLPFDHQPDPPPPPHPDEPPQDNSCHAPGGSTIMCDSQAVGEDVGVAGTPMTLHYQSDRVPGYTAADALDIPVTATAGNLDLVDHADVDVDIDGHAYHHEFCLPGGQSCAAGAQPVSAGDENGLAYQVVWDHTDGFGRQVTGGAIADVTITYWTDLSYSYSVATSGGGGGGGVGEAFGSVYPSQGTTQARQLEPIADTEQVPVGPAGNNASIGLGQWGLSALDSFDPATGVLHRGDGSDELTSALAPTLDTVAGSDNASGLGDGGPATSAGLQEPAGVLELPDGSILIADCGDNRLRKVSPAGTITTIAGDGTAAEGGDGGPATSAQLNCPTSIARGSDGSLYVADDPQSFPVNATVRRIAPNGTITTIAGGGSTAPPDAVGNPATDAQLSQVAQVAVGPDNSVYIADAGNGLIERVDPTGALGIVDYDSSTLRTLDLEDPEGVAVNAAGDVLVADGGQQEVLRYRGLNPPTVVAGTGDDGDAGDGGPATQAKLSGPANLSLLADGSLFVAEREGGRVRLIAPDGTIRTVAGGGQTFPGQSDNPLPAGAAELFSVSGVYGTPDGSVVLSSDFGFVFKTKSSLAGAGANATLVPSSDGSTVDAFDAGGREEALYDATTGVKLLSFAYDSAGRLSAIADAYGRPTTVQRDASGTPTALVAPGGQTTTLTVDSAGRLATITDPVGDTTTLAYDDPTGQLSGLTDPNGKSSSTVYDSLGRVTSDTDPGGGVTTLSHTIGSDGESDITVHVPGGGTQVYKDAIDGYGDDTRTSIDPSGATTRVTTYADGESHEELPDGTTVDSTATGDPRFGMAAPITTSLTVNTPNGAGDLTESATRTVTLSDSNDPLSVKSSDQTFTVDNNQTDISYDGPSRTFTLTSPEGRVSTSTYDDHDALVSSTVPQSPDAVTYTHDATTGELTGYAQGDRSETLTYDSAGSPVTATNAAGDEVQYTWDGAGRLTSLTKPDGDKWSLHYDSDGGLTSLTMPDGKVHKFTWTAIGELASYLPPSASGGTSLTYNPARQLTQAALPGGVGTLGLSYDGGGRLTGTSSAEGDVQMAYAGNTDLVKSLTRTVTGSPAQTQTLTLSHDGDLLTGQTFAGPAAGAYAYTYKGGHLTDLALTAGSSSVDTPQTYDTDGLQTGAGPFSFTLDSSTGLTTDVTDNTADESIRHDEFGSENQRSLTVDGHDVYSETLTRNTAGRITQRQETVAGTSHTYTYSYNGDGELTDVKTDGTPSEAYAYNPDGDLTSRQSGGAAAQAISYDDQDRENQLGSTAYTFDAAGQLTGRGSDTFSYGARLGELEWAKAGATTVTYRYDALGRRVARTQGAATEQYLYGDPENLNLLTASIASDGTLTAYDYDQRGRLLGFTRGSSTYYVATDKIGSPMVVTDAHGTVVKAIAYDAYGKVLSDSAPSFALDIGYAGGLQDPLTGLVRFGVRDYDPASGRFTTRDPTLVEGGLNFYAYVGGDPVDFTDPTGFDDPLQYTQAPPLDPGTNPDGSWPSEDPPAPPPTPAWKRAAQWVEDKIDQKLVKPANDVYDACYEAYHNTGPRSVVDLAKKGIDYVLSKLPLPLTPANMTNQTFDQGVSQSEGASDRQSMGVNEWNQYQESQRSQ